jgi:hypothetical protein
MLRESNDDLKDQLHRERTEERRKLTAATASRQQKAEGGQTDRYKSPFLAVLRSRHLLFVAPAPVNKETYVALAASVPVILL